ncbi:MAG: hypothetical protein QOJ09_191 [Actinomycetota bacterium]|nr:hypothetical protein [Actinomycetota bacterium]
MTAADRWRRLPVGGRVVAVVVGALVAVELALGTLESVTGGSGPSGPPSSSYATKPEGLAAYADLLTHAGHPVTRLRTAIVDVDPRSTMVVADASLGDGEVTALRRFVDAGGRLVLAGALSAPAAGALLDGQVRWEPTSSTVARPVAPAVAGLGDLAALGTVRTAGEGAFTDTGGALPVLAAGQRAVAAIGRAGAGTIVVLSDPSPLQNRLLSAAGNAAFGLAAAGDSPRPVVFSEAGHGYGRRSGVDALPSGWRWALLGGLVAVLVWIWSRGRRLGPPDTDDEEPAPSRRAYVDAMAATLLRTGDPAGAIAPVQAAARQQIARRAGVSADADDDVRGAAVRLGLNEHDADAIISPVQSHDDAIRAARALAKLGGRA